MRAELRLNIQWIARRICGISVQHCTYVRTYVRACVAALCVLLARSTSELVSSKGTNRNLVRLSAQEMRSVRRRRQIIGILMCCISRSIHFSGTGSRRQVYHYKRVRRDYCDCPYLFATIGRDGEVPSFRAHAKYAKKSDIRIRTYVRAIGTDVLFDVSSGKNL